MTNHEATLAAVRILQDAQSLLDIAVAESFRDDTKIGTWADAFSGRELVLHAIARLYRSAGYVQTDMGWIVDATSGKRNLAILLQSLNSQKDGKS